MKEHFQDYGVRKWAGDDLIELQSEPLAALQALVEPYAPCIIQGCEVTENGDGGIKVSPGLVALKGKDSKGNACVKIARFAGVESETSIYLTLACEAVNRLYGDGNVKDIAYDYKAVASTQRPEEPFLEISGKEVPRLVDTLGITQKLDREGGNASNVKVVSFKEDTATGRINIAAGMTLKELFGRIYRWLRDLGALAFKSKVEETDLETTLGTKLNGIEDKLEGIEAGAQVNVQADWSETKPENDAYIKNKPGNATQSTPGLMSADDKKKLEGIAAGAQVNVQADWSVTDANSDAYIKNKPTASNIGGKLPIANGGTGESNGEDAANVLLNSLREGTEAPKDADYYIAQYSGGGTSVNTYHRRPVSKLLDYIKSKLAFVATSGNYNDLSNKPAIGNGTITIKQAGTNKGSFSVNQGVNTTIELTDDNTVYTHPTYTARTGVPAANQTPSFGSTFNVTQPVSDSSGHITGMNTRTVKIPSDIASTSAAGLMSAADKKKLDKIGDVSISIVNGNTVRLKWGETTGGGNTVKYGYYYADLPGKWYNGPSTSTEIGGL